MDKNIGKNISKILNGKNIQKLLDYAKQSAADALKNTSKRVIQIKVEGTGDMISKKIAESLKTSSQNNSETITNEHDKEIPKERYISRRTKEIIDDLRLI